MVGILYFKNGVLRLLYADIQIMHIITTKLCIELQKKKIIKLTLFSLFTSTCPLGPEDKQKYIVTQ